MLRHVEPVTSAVDDVVVDPVRLKRVVVSHMGFEIPAVFTLRLGWMCSM